MTRHIVLFLAANPSGTNPVALEQEARSIQVELERGGFRNCFELATRWAAEPLDLLHELRKLKPTIVHFSGQRSRTSGAHRSNAASRGKHAVSRQRRGLFFQSSDGGAQLVSTRALKDAFGAAGSSVKLVVLNACYSERQANALTAHVDCVVGMNGSIRDDAAKTFAIGFYGGLAERESVAAAYRQGRAAIGLDGLCDGERPQLKVRSGVDAERLVIASEPTPPLASAVVQAGNMPADSETLARSETVHIEFDFVTDYDAFPMSVLDEFSIELSRITKTLKIKIVRVRKGSVKVTISLPVEAAKLLLELRANGQLSRICGYEISSIVEVDRIAGAPQITLAASDDAFAEARIANVFSTSQEANLARALQATGTDANFVVSRAISSVESALAAMPHAIESDPIGTHPSVLVSDPDYDIRLLGATDQTEAVRLLMMRYARSVYRYCRSALQDSTLAEDVQQIVFIQAHRDLPKFQGRSTVRTWLFAIAHHRVIDGAKARMRAQARSEGTNVDDSDPTRLASEQLDDAAMQAALAMCVEKLPERMRTAVLLRYQAGFTFPEMANICDEKENTLKSRVARALPLLRACIEARTGGR